MEALFPRRPTPEQPSGAEGSQSQPSAIEVQQALEEVLSSPPFCHTLQCQKLLRYIVDRSLAQEDNLLRERVIGAQIFGREPSYETGEDPIVRLRVSEVRKRLAQFYQSVSESNRAPAVQIDIPAGSYRACFRWRGGLRSPQERGSANTDRPREPEDDQGLKDAPLSSASTGEITAETVKEPTRNRALAWVFAVSTTLLIMAVVSIYSYTQSNERPIDAFWAPWTNTSKQVIISVGSNAVYLLSDQITDRYAREHNLEREGVDFFVPLDPKSTLKGSDLTPAHGSFVALGDVAAVTDVAAMLTSHKQKFHDRFPNDISFADIHSSPSILIGGFNNPMTIEVTKYLPLVLAARNEIDETRPPGRRWTLHPSADAHHTQDYAIITRLVGQNTDAPVLSVAGMGQYGTLAAANFICSPSSMKQLANRLPKNWAQRSLQVLLHVDVVDFEAQSTQVVAVRTW